MHRACVMALSFGVLAGCSLNYGDGDFLCSETRPDCPDGYDCVDGRCRTGGGSDAGFDAADTGADGGDTGVEDGGVDEGGTDTSPPPSCTVVTTREASGGAGSFGSLAMGRDTWFWRFLQDEEFCVTELGINLVESEPGTRLTLALFQLGRGDEVPDRDVPHYAVEERPGAISVPTEVVATIPAQCLGAEPRFWAVGAWSDDGSTVIPSLGHGRPMDSPEQRVHRDQSGTTETVGGARMFVRGCTPP